MVNMKIKKLQLKKIIKFAALSFGVVISSLSFGMLKASKPVDSIQLGIQDYIQKYKTKYAYGEVSPNKSNILLNDNETQKLIYYDNYWHFGNRPNNFVFYKWDAVKSNTGDDIFPLSFEYGSENAIFNLPIISLSGARWNGDLSHISLSFLHKDENYEKFDSELRQRSIVLSYDLALEMSNGNPIENLVGQEIVSSVFINASFKPAHYNNNPSKNVIDKCYISGILDKNSYLDYVPIYGEKFVYMENDFGLYNHCGIKIGSVFSKDSIANSVALNDFLKLNNDKSNITFYDVHTNSKTIGYLDDVYRKNVSFYDNRLLIISASLSIIADLVFVSLIILLLFKHKKEKTSCFSNLTICLISFLIFSGIFYLVKKINIKGLILPVITVNGVLLMFVSLIIVCIANGLIFRKQKQSENKSVILQNTISIKKPIKLLIPHSICSFCFSLSSYVLIGSLKIQNLNFFGFSLLTFIGSILFLFSLFKNQTSSKKKILSVVSGVGVFLGMAISTGVYFLIVRTKPFVVMGYAFNLKSLIISSLFSIAIIILVYIFSRLSIKRKEHENYERSNTINI